MSGKKTPQFIITNSMRISLYLVLAPVIAATSVHITVDAALKDPANLAPAISASAQTTGEFTVLEPGKMIEREMSGGQKHSYHIAISEGQYIKVEINQKGADVGVNFQLPDGQITQPFEPFGGQPELQFAWVAESSGIYCVNIYTTAQARAGRYEIRLAEMRPATENDRALQQARRLFVEYGRLNREARYAEARTLLTKVLEIREKVLGSDDLLVATTLSFLASSCKATGDYASAEPFFLRALKIKERALGPEHPEVALALTDLGSFYQGIGDYLNSDETDRRALGIYERAQLMETPAVASLLNSLGGICYIRGDYQNAEKYYERSRAVWEKLLGPDHFHIAPSYSHLGRVAYDAGDYAKAEAMFQRALALTEKGLGPDHTNVTKYLNDLGMVYSTTGDYAKAAALYRRALLIREQKAAMGGPEAQETLYGLARCFAAQGKLSDAVKFQSRASELAEEYLALNLVVGSEREKLAFLATMSSRLSRTISLHTHLAPDDPAALDLAVTTILQRKGRAQDAMSASLSALRQRFGPEDQKVLDQLKEITSRLANLVLKGPQNVSPNEHLEQIKSLDAQRENLEIEISERSAGFYSRSQPVTLAAVQTAIPDDAALIEFAVYQPFDPKAPDNQKAYGEPRYVAYVVRSQGEVQWKDLGEAKAIDEAIDASRQALRDPQQTAAKQLARTVDEKIMQPVRPLTGDAKHLLISPDGALNLIPFEALVDEQGHFLIQRYSISYVTSGRDLLRLQVARSSATEPIVMADPFFGEPEIPEGTKTGTSTRRKSLEAKRRSITTGEGLSDVYFAPLAGTEQEARSIKQLFPEANILTGRQATKSALKQARAPRILHIATHGFFLKDAHSDAAPVTSNRKASATRVINASVKIENPLLRSGLALAGANLHKSGNDDGILTALEASGLNLWGTKLVTLSACDTGVGEVKNGEGVYGLRRAFVLAGTETLMMSLWPVSDYLTRQLMTEYYKGLKQGLGRCEALRQVKLTLLERKDHQHPFFWASFIQSGEWADLDGHR
jgi:CHAT domain-containing protein/Tfp pilus assembly protein PilF